MKSKELFEDIERLTKGREQLSKKELNDLKKKYLDENKKEEGEIKIKLNIKSEWIDG